MRSRYHSEIARKHRKRFPEPRRTGSHWAKGLLSRSCGLWLRHAAHWKWDPVGREPSATERGQGKLPRSRERSFQGAEKVKERGRTSTGERHTQGSVLCETHTHSPPAPHTHSKRGKRSLPCLFLHPSTVVLGDKMMEPMAMICPRAGRIDRTSCRST